MSQCGGSLFRHPHEKPPEIGVVELVSRLRQQCAELSGVAGEPCGKWSAPRRRPPPEFRIAGSPASAFLLDSRQPR